MMKPSKGLITYDLCNPSPNPSNYLKTQIKGEKMKYQLFDIEIIESQFDNNPLGVPDIGTPEEALQDFLNYCPNSSEDCISKGENDFVIWRDEVDGQYFANAWTVNPETGEREYLAYYEFKATPTNKFTHEIPEIA